MKKGEFNPPHIHPDCDFSSVLYLNIPPGLEKEREQFIGKGYGPGSIIFTLTGAQRFHNNEYSFTSSSCIGLSFSSTRITYSSILSPE